MIVLRLALAFGLIGTLLGFGIWIAKGDHAVEALSLLAAGLLFIVVMVATVARIW